MKEKILEILKKESIRLLDGRYSKGFVDLDELKELISEGKAEVYENQEMKFVRRPK